mmetsp:Transcript_12756/g.41970  ORF Transcript_12756/g.41970 Transcript_12756/m.41970 type:complete len:206 (-) Transcript_12756:214-831(-)
MEVELLDTTAGSDEQESSRRDEQETAEMNKRVAAAVAWFAARSAVLRRPASGRRRAQQPRRPKRLASRRLPQPRQPPGGCAKCPSGGSSPAHTDAPTHQPSTQRGERQSPAQGRLQGSTALVAQPIAFLENEETPLMERRAEVRVYLEIEPNHFALREGEEVEPLRRANQLAFIHSKPAVRGGRVQDRLDRLLAVDKEVARPRAG